jgi:hypothetical protein
VPAPATAAEVGLFGPSYYEIGYGFPGNVAIGDFNADSDPDLAVPTSGSFSGSQGFSVLLGEPGATFGDWLPHQMLAPPRWVSVGDFNGDTDLDVAASAENDVYVFSGGPDASFSTGPSYDLGAGSAGPSAVGDFNGDGDPDLAIINTGAVRIFLGGAGSTFSAAPGSPYPAVGAIRIAVGDFNGDADPDLAVSRASQNSAVNSGVTILLGGPGAAFTQEPIIPLPVNGLPMSQSRKGRPVERSAPRRPFQTPAQLRRWRLATSTRTRILILSFCAESASRFRLAMQEPDSVRR